MILGEENQNFNISINTGVLAACESRWWDTLYKTYNLYICRTRPVVVSPRKQTAKRTITTVTTICEYNFITFGIILIYHVRIIYVYIGDRFLQASYFN